MPFKAEILARVIALGLASMAVQASAAEVDTVTIDDMKVGPESITSTKAGDLIIGSSGKGAIYRAKAGSDKATLWLDPAKTGIVSLLGVFAHEKSNTLYACSISPFGPGPKRPELSVLRAFDLKTGADKGAYPMIKPESAFCNDVDVAADGTVFVTDTGNENILRLGKGGKALEVWAHDQRLGGADGIAIDGRTVYVNTILSGRLFSIPITASGAAGPLLELKPSLPLASPDGMRALDRNRFLMAENTGRISVVTVTGDKAEIRELKNDPGVTAITRVGNRIWVNNNKKPEPAKLYAIPLK